MPLSLRVPALIQRKGGDSEQNPLKVAQEAGGLKMPFVFSDILLFNSYPRFSDPPEFTSLVISPGGKVADIQILEGENKSLTEFEAKANPPVTELRWKRKRNGKWRAVDVKCRLRERDEDFGMGAAEGERGGMMKRPNDRLGTSMSVDLESARLR